MILILTNSSDGHSDVVTDSLRSKGIKFVRFDTDTFPLKVGTALHFSNSTEKSYLQVGQDRLDLARVCCVWYRRPVPPSLSEIDDVENRKFATSESSHVLKALWHLLGHCFWVNPYESTGIAEYKPYQLSVARKIGLRIPRTLMTNDPAEALAFFDHCDGNVVYKTFTPSFRENKDGRPLGIYTTRVRREDIESRALAIRLAPCIFQEYVPKSIELRVTVMGQAIFTAQIDSQKSARARDDWRRYDCDRSLYKPYELPAKVENKIRELMSQLHLVFGCIDLIVTPDQDFVFLEINPNGQWYWVEMLTGMRMLESFTNLLTGRTSYPCDQNIENLPREKQELR